MIATEQLAVIKNLEVGSYKDHSSTGLLVHFSVYLDEHQAADINLYGDKALEFIRTSGFQDITKLEGGVCFIDIDENTNITFNRHWKR